MNPKVHKRTVSGQVPTRENVAYRLVDRNGKAKKLFQMNRLGKSILGILRRLFPNPITPEGQVKPGLSNHLAAYGLRIPLLTGFWTEQALVKNLVPSAGKAGIASRINGSGGEAAFTYIAVGTGTTAPAAGDTTLQTESSTSGLSRAAATASRVTTSVANDTAQLVVTFSVTGTVAVTESGIFNAASVGTLGARQTFSAINVVNGDSLQITWKVQVS